MYDQLFCSKIHYIWFISVHHCTFDMIKVCVVINIYKFNPTLSDLHVLHTNHI